MTTPCPSCGYTGKPWPGKGTDRLGALIVKLVAHAAHMEVEEMLASDRSRVYITARAACAKIMRKHGELRWKQIGYILAGRTHSTVISSQDLWRNEAVERLEAEVLAIMKRNIDRPIA